MLDLEHASGQLMREGLPVFFGLPLLPAIVFTPWGQPGGPAAVATAERAQALAEVRALEASQEATTATVKGDNSDAMLDPKEGSGVSPIEDPSMGSDIKPGTEVASRASEGADLEEDSQSASDRLRASGLSLMQLMATDSPAEGGRHPERLTDSGQQEPLRGNHVPNLTSALNALG